MKTRFHLPSWKQRKDVENTLIDHHLDGDVEVSQHAWNWTRCHWFLQGVRRLTILGTDSRTIPTPHQTLATGNRVVRIDKAAAVLQTEIGRLLGIDLRPAVQRRSGVALDEIRSTALAQVMLDNFVDRYDFSTFQLGLWYMLAAYGTAGIGGFDVGERAGGVFGATLLLIPPWELRPLPSGVTGIDQVAGVEWCRWVPMSWLKANYKDVLRWPKDRRDDKLGLMEATPGMRVQSEYSPVAGRSPVNSGTVGTALHRPVGAVPPNGDTTADDYSEDYVHLREFWVYGDDYSCLRWSILLGEHLALDVDYTDESSRQAVGLEGNSLPIAPVHVARYMPVGSFYGKGFIERQVELNRELEFLFSEMIQDMRESNKLRVLAVPQSSGINLRNFSNHLRNRLLVYQPDYAANNARPEILAPPTLGEVPGKTINLLMGVIGDLAAQGPMYRGQVPGRLESSPGVAMVAEQQNVPLAATAESVSGAMTGVWKSVLGVIRRRAQDMSDLTLNRLDESVIGVKFDRTTGHVELDPDVLPSPQTILVSVRNKFPRPKQAIKEDLLAMLQAGLISKTDVRIMSVREDLGLPFVTRTDYEHYGTAWMENIILFGDGEKSGQVLFNPQADNHPIHLVIHQCLMAMPFWRLASVEVRARFLEHINYHLENMGVFPDQLLSAASAGVGAPNPMMAGMMAGEPPRPGQQPMPEVMGTMMPGPAQ